MALLDFIDMSEDFEFPLFYGQRKEEILVIPAL